MAGESDTAIIFFLKTPSPRVYGDQLRLEEREKIRLEAREQVLNELQAGMQLPAPAHKALMAAIPPALSTSPVVLHGP